MKKYLMQYSLFFILFLSISCTQSVLPDEWRNEVQRRVDLSINQGIVIATIDSTDHIQYYNFGKEDESNSLVNENSTFEIASISKTFTTTLIRILEEKEKLSTNQEIRTFIPDTLPEKIKRITFKELINHTSGLPRLPHDFWVNDWDNPYVDYSEKDFFFDLNKIELDSVKKWSYSNLGYMLLGVILENLKSEMHLDGLISDLVLGQTHLKNGALTTAPHNFGKKVSNWHFSNFSNYAGGVKSSSSDLIRYLKYQINTNPSFYDFHSPKDILINQDDSIYSREGWLVFYRKKEEIIWHNGISGGYNSFIGYNPQRKSGIVILSNAQNSITDLGLTYLSKSFELERAKFPLINKIDKLIQANELDSIEYLWSHHDTLKYQKAWSGVYWLQGHYISQHKYDIALKLNRILISEFENDWEAYYYKGKIYELMRKNKLATDSYRKANSLFPENNFLVNLIERLEKSDS